MWPAEVWQAEVWQAEARERDTKGAQSALLHAATHALCPRAANWKAARRSCGWRASL